MPNLRLTYPNIIDLATITTSVPVSTTMPVTNLQSDLRKSVFQTLDGYTFDIKLSWTRPQNATMFGLGRNTLSSSATVQPIFYTDAAWLTLLSTGASSSGFNPTGLSSVDTGELTDASFRMLKNTDYYFSSPGSFRSAIIRIFDPAPYLGIVEISRLFMGSYKELAINPFYAGGLSLTSADMSKQSRSYGGSMIVDKREKFMQMPIMLEWVRDATDRADLLAFARSCGLDKTLWVSMFPGANDYMDVYSRGPMKFTQIPPMSPWLSTHSKTQLTLEGL